METSQNSPEAGILHSAFCLKAPESRILLSRPTVTYFLQFIQNPVPENGIMKSAFCILLASTAAAPWPWRSAATSSRRCCGSARRSRPWQRPTGSLPSRSLPAPYHAGVAHRNERFAQLSMQSSRRCLFQLSRLFLSARFAVAPLQRTADLMQSRGAVMCAVVDYRATLATLVSCVVRVAATFFD